MSHPVPDAADSFDLLADVSHHGASSFFDLFASAPLDPPRPNLDPPYLTNPTPFPSAPQFIPHHDPATSNALSHVTASVTAPDSLPSTIPRSQPPPKRTALAPKRRSASIPRAPASASKRRKPRSTSVKLEDETEASDESAPPHTPQQLPSSTSNPPQTRNSESLTNPDPNIKDTHNSHTRKCRAKVNSKFKELLGILPTPPPNTGIKHKAQILDYTIRVFRDIHARKTLLEAELALSSPSQLNAWISNIVSRSVSLQDALAPYLSLICTKGAWKYSEAWVPLQDPEPNTTNDPLHAITGESRFLTPSNMLLGPNARLRFGVAVIPSLGNTDDPDLQPKLERFRDSSRSYTCKPRVDLPGRIMCTMRPEWLPSLEDHEAFQRAELARDASLVVCFGVPIFIGEHVAAVAVFYDIDQRTFDAKFVDRAADVARMLGSAYGTSAMKRVNFR